MDSRKQRQHSSASWLWDVLRPVVAGAEGGTLFQPPVLRLQSVLLPSGPAVDAGQSIPKQLPVSVTKICVCISERSAHSLSSTMERRCAAVIGKNSDH